MCKEVKFAIAIWLVLMTLYMNHTSSQERSHDFWDHVEYTKILVDNHRLPYPSEGWETYQPPLYYILNSFVLPQTIKNNTATHINFVRLLSVIYGVVALFLISSLISEVTNNIIAKTLALMFIATTPTYIFIFSTYNNDSLMTLLCIGLIFIFRKLEKNWSPKNAFILYVLATASLYTKITSIVCIGSLFFICMKSLLISKMPSKLHLKIVGLLFLSIISLLPWMVFHNYKHARKLIPSNDITLKDISILTKNKRVLGLLLKNEKLLGIKHDFSHEWGKPWAYPENRNGKKQETTKKYDYFGFTFITSVIGEYVLTKPHVLYIWIILFIHLMAYIGGLFSVLNSEITKFAGLIILFSTFCHIILFSPYAEFYASFIDYRYISWNWILWSILYTSLLAHKDKFICKWSKAVFLTGIFIQSYIMISIKGGYWW